MAGGFTKNAGPTAPQPRFGNFTARSLFPPSPSLSPPLPGSVPPQSPRDPGSVGQVRSPPLVYDSFIHESTSGASSPYQAAGFPRGPGYLERVRSSPTAFQSTYSSSCPTKPSAGAQRPVESPYTWVNGQMSNSNDDAQTIPRSSAVTSLVASHNSGSRVRAQISRYQDSKWTRSPMSRSADGNISRNSNQSLLQNPSNSAVDNDNNLVPPQTRSPPLAIKRNSSIGHVRHPFGEDQRPVLYRPAFNQPRPGTSADSLAQQDQSSTLPPYISSYDSGRIPDVRGPKRTRSPPIPHAGEVSKENIHIFQNESKRPSVSHATMATSSNASFRTSESQTSERNLPSAYNTAEALPTMTTNFSVAKQSKSPPLLSSDEIVQGNSHSTHDGTEREMQAKAKHLARFKEELNENLESKSDILEQKISASRSEQSTTRRFFVMGQPGESAGDSTDGNTQSDLEALKTSTVIVGLCPDMCPESERAERERKGDLDQYERLDGDRNQTNKFLAVKKYNRTAEREASLIRPLPILEKTVDYLLSLLDQPYSDNFLGMYNFLWDRMRAIRMDLRMQHIFNQEAIKMLEQMIRLHIIAMHELCEYAKGEGFFEGFDAHLNIEQMNKTSVELFQMYDDHRKKGISVPSEHEFRGYYALLKLDKHPGYKVEPSELSLDLAKMTPEIRQTPEVLFARDVARACRTGNFIAFFRLARKASYLQACLMHAHFSKLRTQAFASLHSGLQNNQGLPVAHVARWLAMEEEDIEGLLDYYGFSIKEFEEPYMVKEGSFLNGDKDYPTKCSKLVHLKKSRTIIEDVSQPSQMASVPSETAKDRKLPKKQKDDNKAVSSAFIDRKSSIHQIDEKLPDFRNVPSQKIGRQLYPSVSSPKFSTPVQPFVSSPKISTPIQPFVSFPKVSTPISSPKLGTLAQPIISSPKVGTSVQPLFGESIFIHKSQNDQKDEGSHSYPWGFSVAYSSPELQQSKFGVVENSPEIQPPRFEAVEKSTQDVFPLFSVRNTPSDKEVTPSQIVSRTGFPERCSSGKYGYSAENSGPQNLVSRNSDDAAYEISQENEDEVMENCGENEDEVLQAKIKLIIRLWKRRTSKLRELRERRLVAANAALSFLSLGPPIRHTKDQPGTGSEFNIDRVMRERHEKLKQSWSRINVSEVVADILGRRNPDAKCLCWKVILCSQNIVKEANKFGEKNQVMKVSAGQWLSSKLMPYKTNGDEDGCDTDLLISSPDLSIWNKWVPDQCSNNLTCCLSVVRNVKFDGLMETVAGASAILFIVSENIPWNLQRSQLHSLLSSIPFGSSLPLLVLSDSCSKKVPDLSSIITTELGLLDIDKSKVSSSLVVFIFGDEQTESLDGFFSDTQLKEGLQWLASESPINPDVHCTKTRELVLSHLNYSLDALERMSDYEVGPGFCISAFNEAVGWCMGEIAAAAKANPAGWPCPEINLLEHLSDEHVAMKCYLPATGWSSAERTEPLLSALTDCKLPEFPDDILWLNQGANAATEIEGLRSKLESCLIKYLTQSSGIMGLPLATKEAHVMLQRGARLELHHSTYYIVPKWVMIFRRIFNWRLTNLSNGDFSLAYVLKHHHMDPTSQMRDEFMLEGNLSAPYISQPSLDEIIDVSYGSLFSGKVQPYPEAPQSLQVTVAHADIQVDGKFCDSREYERTCADNGKLVVTDNVDQASSIVLNGDGTESAVDDGKATREADKLSKLLEQCNILQNAISDKLSIYF